MQRWRVLIPILFISLSIQSSAQSFIPLWPAGKQPNTNGKVITDTLYNERIWRVATPGMYVFPVGKAEGNGAAVLICPGGGYERLSHIYNGFNLARWYNTLGITAFVLIYRLPHQVNLVDRSIAPLQDAQRAMKLIRSNAIAWSIDPSKVGVMGTSAGGHVASSLGTSLKDASLIGDSLDTVRFQPNFMVLLSPVINVGKYSHGASQKNLLGPNPSQALMDKYSNELNVTPQTPTTFLVHAQNDSTVKVQNSLLFYSALLQNKVSSTLHIFPQGGHGIRLKDNPGSTELWMPLLEAWLRERGILVPLPFK